MENQGDMRLYNQASVMRVKSLEHIFIIHLYNKIQFLYFVL